MNKISLVLPEYSKSVLRNQLTLIILPLNHLPIISFRLLTKGGAVSDSASKCGCANLVMEVSQRSTRSFPDNSLHLEVEKTGGVLNTFAGMEYSVVTGEFLKAHCEQGLRFISEIVRFPEFLSEDIEKEKRRILGDLANKRENPSYLADMHFKNFLYQRHPYGNPVEGFQSGLASIVRTDVVGNHQSCFSPRNSILAVAGDCDSSMIEASVVKWFGDWRNDDSREFSCDEPPQSNSIRIRIVDKPEMNQAQIRLGNIGIARNDPAYYPVIVMNTILGGGFTSRLVQEVRVKRGLTYGIWSRFVSRSRRGEFVIGTFTKNESLLEVVSVLREEMAKLAGGFLSADELKKAQEYMMGIFPSGLEAHENILRHLIDIEYYNLDHDFLMNHLRDIERVSCSEVIESARRFLPVESPVLTVAGDAERIGSALETIGPVETFPYDRMLDSSNSNDSAAHEKE